MAVFPEIETLGVLTTEGSLSLASRNYSQLRKFAPAFLEVFSVDVSRAGADLQAALTFIKEHNQSGKRELPDDVPMPFPAKNWKSLIMQHGKPQRRGYETAVMATLRDRLRALEMPGWREARTTVVSIPTWFPKKKPLKLCVMSVCLKMAKTDWMSGAKH